MTDRILITGSRDWDDVETLRAALDVARAEYPDALLMSGACPTGADYLCEEYFRELGGQVIRYPANWRRYGKQAGFIRNEQMVKLGAVVCLAFRKNNSRGTTHTGNLATQAGIETRWFIQDE